MSFDAVFVAEFGPVYRFAARRVGTHLADDIASETFALAYEKWSAFDPERGSPRAWLFGIASNLLRNHWRAEQRILERDARLARACELPVAYSMASSEPELASVVARSLLELPASHREVLLLYAWADLSYEEIAVALGLATGTVRSRLARARHSLRSRLRAASDAPRTLPTLDGGTDD